MKIGILGTGSVGTTLGSALIALDHEVTLGSRTPDNATAVEWASAEGSNAHHGTFADAAAFGEIVLSCILGTAAVAAVTPLASIVAGKVVVDISNPIDFSKGFPTLNPVGDNSLGEQIQRALPDATVVKTFNTLSAAVMVDPARVRAQTLFMSGDAASAKDRVRSFLHEFGWTDDQIIDLGGIQTARATEMMLPLWVVLMQTLGTTDFGIHVTH